MGISADVTQEASAICKIVLFFLSQLHLLRVQSAGLSVFGADDFLPLFIYVIVHSRSGWFPS